MTEQEEKDFYRFYGYRWTRTDKSVSNSPKDDYYEVPVAPDYKRLQPLWWGQKATSKQPL